MPTIYSRPLVYAHNSLCFFACENWAPHSARRLFDLFALSRQDVYLYSDVLFRFYLHILDQNELLAARQFLEQAAASNIAEFLKALSEVLANINCSSVARTAAGLQLKNHLTSKDASITEQYHKQWLSFPEVTREYIKNNVS